MSSGAGVSRALRQIASMLASSGPCACRHCGEQDAVRRTVATRHPGPRAPRTMLGARAPPLRAHQRVTRSVACPCRRRARHESAPHPRDVTRAAASSSRARSTSPLIDRQERQDGADHGRRHDACRCEPGCRSSAFSAATAMDCGPKYVGDRSPVSDGRRSGSSVGLMRERGRARARMPSAVSSARQVYHDSSRELHQ